MAGRLILIPGDQLSLRLSSLHGADRAHDRVLMAEVTEEATYVRHHQMKIAFVLSAMRHFADDLRADGWQVDYVRLDDPDNSQSLAGEVRRALARHGLSRVAATEPGEWRLLAEMQRWPDVELRPDNRLYWHFIARHRDRRAHNPRMAQIVRTWERFSAERQAELLNDGDRFLATL